MDSEKNPDHKESQSSSAPDVVNIDSDEEDNSSVTMSEASTILLNNGAESENVQAPKRKNKSLSLIVSNLPKNFNYTQIKNFLEDACGSCDVRMLKDGDKSRNAKAVFRSPTQLARAKEVLNANSIDEFNIIAYESDSDLQIDDEGPQPKRKKEAEDSSWGLDLDLWRTDPRGLYGVKPQFLETLGIKDALQNWVLVINFRCGREELKEVMELAGDVQVCTVMSQKMCPYANVMYRHPLEALQAISMLNGQMFYGRPLTVKLLKRNDAGLPKGLSNIGPGLAKYGKPLRDVVKHFKRFLKGTDNNLNMNIFRTPLEQAENKDEVERETDDGKTKAKDAIENLIAEGIEVKDILHAIEVIIKDRKDDSLDALIAELGNAVEMEKKSDSNSGDKESGTNSSENSNNADKSTPGSSKPVLKSVEESKGSGTPQRSSSSSASVQSDRSVPKITQSTPSATPPTNIRCKPLNQIRSVVPKSIQQSSRPRNSGPGPVRPMRMGGSPFGSNTPRNVGPNKVLQGPRFGASGTSGPVRPIVGPITGSQGPMSGPISRLTGPAWAASGPSGPMPGSGGPISIGPGGPTGSGGPMGPNPMSQIGPMGPGGPMGQGRPMGQGGPIGQGGPMGQGGPIGPGGPMSQGGQIGQGGSMGQGGPMGPMGGPSGPMVGPMPFGASSGSEAILQFSNLPLNTTFALLNDKLSKVGQLQSIQFTLPGCVLVKYASRAHAERCLQLFNQTRLDGNLITVSFL